jgi:hypothetical protein
MFKYIKMCLSFIEKYSCLKCWCSAGGIAAAASDAICNASYSAEPALLRLMLYFINNSSDAKSGASADGLVTLVLKLLGVCSAAYAGPMVKEWLCVLVFVISGGS